MYHTSTENQLFNIKKSFLTKGFDPKNLQTGDINEYIDCLTSSEQGVIRHLLEFRHLPEVKLINSSIAKAVGCSRITVIRATNKFHKDGVITKRQPQPYDANIYSFNEKVKKGPGAFMYWLNNLPKESKDIYISHGIIIDHKNKKVSSYRNDTPYLSSLILESLFKKSSPLFTRARERDQSFSKKIKGKIMNPLETNKQSRMYPIWKAPEEPPIRDQIIRLKNDIRSLSQQIEANKAKAYMISFAVSLVERKMNELKSLEAQSNEKQNISYQYTSDSMAAYSS
jgi:hypothetical protein